jgi:hypothetical protein
MLHEFTGVLSRSLVGVAYVVGALGTAAWTSRAAARASCAAARAEHSCIGIGLESSGTIPKRSEAAISTWTAAIAVGYACIVAGKAENSVRLGGEARTVTLGWLARIWTGDWSCCCIRHHRGIPRIFRAGHGKIRRYSSIRHHGHRASASSAASTIRPTTASGAIGRTVTGATGVVDVASACATVSLNSSIYTGPPSRGSAVAAAATS